MYPTKPPHCGPDGPDEALLAAINIAQYDIDSDFGFNASYYDDDDLPTEPLVSAVVALVTNVTEEANATAAGCYESLTNEESSNFLLYERIVGGYCNCFVGLVGLVGNLLSVLVLSQKEMQKNNCFNKLLIGEEQRKPD